ncbi:1,2-dihydroxy-3-keto-5-methylthiopentene dioxygenase [Smittium mucronatum]|uniref:Acireductone dioxygenase n=1 Tax=Smittium mucronatum TaxID=133383 RepID=A0A1R0GWQ5_9FUNG|nr:1,2-dihydroxy-3-keto-5-methylthiopentene dioxygenase [Smittium mucronatum]
MKAYYYHDDGTHMTLPHIAPDRPALTPSALAAIGLHHQIITDPEMLEVICKERGYVARDTILIDNKFSEAQLSKFFEEHLHEDEEVRYVTDGEGFFDARDANDEWFRMHVSAGDLIILPAGIFHRFTPTETRYIAATRLFKDNPSWVPINRPDATDNEVRKIYEDKVTRHVPF